MKNGNMLPANIGITLLILLVFNTPASATALQKSVNDGIITIEIDGSVNPSTAPITSDDKVSYTLTSDTANGLVINRGNIVFDGNGNSLFSTLIPGTHQIMGIKASYISNVTIKNTKIDSFFDGVRLEHCKYWNILDNNITGSYNAGILLAWSTENQIAGNGIAHNKMGIYCSSHNTFSGNNITDNSVGVHLELTSYETVTGNIIRHNRDGILLSSSDNNRVTGNVISDNTNGLTSYSSSRNSIYHNNILNNTFQVVTRDSLNLWDNGYPSGGNHWSDYAGTDEKSGENQDKKGADGTGDTSYEIDALNKDHYPLMRPWSKPITDLNGDHIISVLDLAIVATAFGSKSREPTYNEKADLDRNGVINILDVVAIAKDFGKLIDQ